jgi:hypothetical protein
MSVGGERDDAARADMARELNVAIYEAGLSLSAGEDEEFEQTFYCECGCMAEVKLSLREYDAAEGAYLKVIRHQEA